MRGLLISIAVCVTATSAHAQTGFVQAGYGVELRRFSAAERDRVFDANAADVTFGFGGFLTPSVTAGLELDFGNDSTAQRPVTVTLAGRPTTVTTRYTMRRRSVAALIGVHSSAARKTRIAAYAGLSLTSVAREIGSDAPPIILSTPADTAVFSDRTASPIIGIDAAVQIAQHLAIVGMVRAQDLTLTGDLRGFNVRPSAAARITF